MLLARGEPTVHTVLGTLPTPWVDVIVLSASALTLLCVLPLCWETYQGRARPAAVTWGIWAPVGLVATVALALSGQPFGTWFLKLFLSLGPVLVFLVAWRWGGDWRTDGFDRAAIALGIVGTTAYVVFYLSDAEWAPYVAVGMAMAVDAVGVWPTWKRAWRDPYNEPVQTYALALVAVLAVLLTLPAPWTFLSAGLLLFLAMQMASIITLLAGGRLLGRPGCPEGTCVALDVAEQDREAVIE